eukprot:3229149-Rhodomonas_salina.1
MPHLWYKSRGKAVDFAGCFTAKSTGNSAYLVQIARKGGTAATECPARAKGEGAGGGEGRFVAA